MEVVTRTVSELALQKHHLYRRSRRYLDKVINSVPDCIISTNPDSKISMINEAGSVMFGYEEKSLIGQSILSLFSDAA
jgi:PAS domain S-box-containing protein